MQAVQAMGDSRQLAAAVYQMCQPEAGNFRCPSCHRKSGSNISKIKKKCWNVANPFCLPVTVQVGYGSSIRTVGCNTHTVHEHHKLMRRECGQQILGCNTCAKIHTYANENVA